MKKRSSSTISQAKTDDQKTPLVPIDSDTGPHDDSNKPQNVIPRSDSSALTQTLAGASHLANLLPTGTLLLFQVLCPMVSNNGHCDHVRRSMTAILLTCCGLSGFLASFTDSFKGSDGKIYYGFATLKGLYTFEYMSPGSGAPDPAKYKLRLVDFMHAFLSVLVFAAIALYDKNVVGCFYPAPKEETEEILGVLPVAIGLVCTTLFVVFPTTRHGIGYPVSN
ncbi:hypothetical protein SUGI_0038080 [Cryptomeria japonica]|uniref:protein DMP3 n=1 Tax=Cryptomeria japonica TaxID=3369 RepID=UPI002408A02E|nr:protein DMP3 [Cryptomeria japonica]GLJ06393.1 hypothetical protein SUGI_0038080 [Cryptomeria japonica]